MIEIAMVDIGYEPNAVEVASGETVEFLFTNEGKLRHEAVIGDEAAQDEHEVEMQEMPGMDMGDSDDGEMDMNHSDDGEMDMGQAVDSHRDEGVVALAVEPGQTEAVTMTFEEPGTLVIGCHESGHWAAGMRADITITT